MPCETLERLLALDPPVRFVHGNGDLGVLAQIRAADIDAATYWGTTSGRPLPEPHRSRTRWAAGQVREYEAVLAGWPPTVRLTIDGVGEVLFCHATPRNEVEVFTRLTEEAKLAPIFEDLGVAAVVCGHTHMQFDRTVAGVRVMNAGSVGAPYGAPGAYWLRLGPDVEMKRTVYDFERAAEMVRRTSYPDAEEAAQGIVAPASAEAALDVFGRVEVG
jgi:predicted phosphodiesterase